MYTAPIKIRNHGKGHSYRDAKGEKVPGVTTIINEGWPKSALIPWAARKVAECALDEWEQLEEMKPSQRYERLRTAANRDRDEAAGRGTKVHKLAVPLAQGKSVQVPEELEPHVDNYVRFLNDSRLIVEWLEFTVVNHTHGYAGRGDVIGRLLNPETYEWERWLLDIKTSRSGVFLESIMQDTGYRCAENIVQANGTYVEMPKVDKMGVVWVRQDDYDLIPIEIDDADFAQFLAVKQSYDWKQTAWERIGEPLAKPEHEEVA